MWYLGSLPGSSEVTEGLPAPTERMEARDDARDWDRELGRLGEGSRSALPADMVCNDENWWNQSMGSRVLELT